MFGSDDRVVVRWTVHGTHTGPFAGLSPTQKKIAVRGISLYRLRDGKITETRNLPDLLALLTQLGAIERKQKAAASS
jgi:predicted ester cyclase